MAFAPSARNHYFGAVPTQPLGNRILCKRITVDEHYPDSRILLLPDRLDIETSQQAEVVAVGPGGRDDDGDLIPMDPALKPGTWILHEAHCRAAGPDDAHFWVTADNVVAILGG